MKIRSVNSLGKKPIVIQDCRPGKTYILPNTKIPGNMLPDQLRLCITSQGVKQMINLSTGSVANSNCRDLSRVCYYEVEAEVVVKVSE